MGCTGSKYFNLHKDARVRRTLQIGMEERDNTHVVGKCGDDDDDGVSGNGCDNLDVVKSNDVKRNLRLI